MKTAIATMDQWLDLLQLAGSGDGHAQYEAGLYFESGHAVGQEEIVRQSKYEAFECFLKAYENGSLEATIKLADYFNEGVYCGKDIGLAMELYKKCMDSGSAVAARKLATIYIDNEDFEAAHELELKAKDLDNS